MFLLKIEPLEITSFFSNNFFPYHGRGTFSIFPLAAPMKLTDGISIQIISIIWIGKVVANGHILFPRIK